MNKILDIMTGLLFFRAIRRIRGCGCSTVLLLVVGLFFLLGSLVSF